MKCKLLITVLTLTCFINGGTALDLSEDNNAKWDRFTKNIKCSISSKIHRIDASLHRLPMFQISLKYTGRENFRIKWDENFGRLLWQGRFLLISKTKNTKETTVEMKYRTSNTYPPRKTMILRRGDVITSMLDFTSLPASYSRNLFRNSGKVAFRLWIKVYGKKKFRPLSNRLLIHIK
ncbi:hypothetical protein ACFL20_03640 [Spirochaetota bacterium]